MKGRTFSKNLPAGLDCHGNQQACGHGTQDARASTRVISHRNANNSVEETWAVGVCLLFNQSAMCCGHFPSRNGACAKARTITRFAR